MWHGNLDAIVASHQDAILGPAQMANAHSQPYADRQQSDGECESRAIRQHPLPVIVSFIGHALIARQIVGDFEPVNERRMISRLGEGGFRARPELEHTVLVFRRGRCNGSLGSHGYQLQDGCVPFSTRALFPEVKIKIAKGRGFASAARLIRSPCRGTCRSRFEPGCPQAPRGYRHSVG